MDRRQRSYNPVGALAETRKMKPPETPIAVSIADACRIAGVGKTTVYELVNANKLESIKLGRRRLIKFASLEALLKEGV